MAEASEPFVNILVSAGSPLSYPGNVYYTGQTFACRYSAANRFVAQGRATLVP